MRTATPRRFVLTLALLGFLGCGSSGGDATDDGSIAPSDTAVDADAAGLADAQVSDATGPDATVSDGGAGLDATPSDGGAGLDATPSDSGAPASDVPLDTDAGPACPEPGLEHQPEYDAACAGNFGCTSLPCGACACACTICDGARCVAVVCDESCSDRAMVADGLTPLGSAAGPLAAADAVFTFVEDAVSLDVAGGPPTEAVWTDESGETHTAALVAPVTLRLEQVLPTGASSVWSECQGGLRVRTLHPALVPVVDEPERGPTARLPLASPPWDLSVAWIRAWEDGTGALYFQWLAPDGLAEYTWDEPVSRGALATPPFPAAAAGPLPDDRSGIHWANAMRRAMGDTCAGVETTVVASDVDLAGDGVCDQLLFWDADCAGLPGFEFLFRCGKTACDYTPGICEAMQPCGDVVCLATGSDLVTTKPCPNDLDCVAAAGEPPLACGADGHCDTWCPLLDGAPLDPDCLGVETAAAYCPGGAKYEQCAGEAGGQVFLRDFQTRAALSDGTCWLLYDIHDPDPTRAGQRVPEFEMPGGLPQPLVSDERGRLTDRFPPYSTWGFECDRGEGDVYRTTWQFGVVVDPSAAAPTDVWTVSNGLYSLAPALADLTFDDALGVLVGQVAWTAREGDDQLVGCATVAVEGAEVAYFGDNDLPVPIEARAATNPWNGRWLAVNVPIGAVSATASVDGAPVAASRVLSRAGGVSIVRLAAGWSFGEPMDEPFPTNPTPADCP